MSNIKKYYIFATLFSVGIMFCTGAILQTFLLQAGFSEQQVYLFNSFIQAVQVTMMFIMIFLSGKIRNVKNVLGFSYLSLILCAVVFLLGAVNPSVLGNPYIVAVFIASGVSYVGFGLYAVLTYCLPYYIFDMKNYGRIMALGGVFTGLTTFALSFLHTFIVAKFNYMQAMAWFFVLAICCFAITSYLCFSLKILNKDSTANKVTRKDMVAVFKNKKTYFLLLPNFTRGIALGIMNVITVIAISKGLLNTATSSYVNVITQITVLLCSLAYVFVCRKISTKNLLLIATVGLCAVFPFCLSFGTVGFLILLCLTFFFRNVVDLAIPVLVTEIIPKEQIGAYTSIRMLVFTGAQAVATLIITPIANAIGYTGLLIFAVAMQFICGFTYYIVAKTTTLPALNNDHDTINNEN